MWEKLTLCKWNLLHFFSFSPPRNFVGLCSVIHIWILLLFYLELLARKAAFLWKCMRTVILFKKTFNDKKITWSMQDPYLFLIYVCKLVPYLPTSHVKIRSRRSLAERFEVVWELVRWATADGVRNCWVTGVLLVHHLKCILWFGTDHSHFHIASNTICSLCCKHFQCSPTNTVMLYRSWSSVNYNNFIWSIYTTS